MKENNIRRPSVAGMFYSTDNKELEDEIGRYFTFAKKEVSKDVLQKARGAKILVVPHAGYQYSGYTAACGYWALQHVIKKPKKIVLVGPSHRLYFGGVAVAGHDAWKTPLGTVPVEKKSSSILLAQFPDLIHRETALFDGEHSLEVQVPFLQTIFNNTVLTPIMYSEITSRELTDIFEAVDDDNTVFIVSSDLSHFMPYREAQKTDSLSNEYIKNAAIDEAEDHLDACGKTGIIAAMRYAKKLGLSTIVVNYLNSGDTAGDKESVVGYATHLFYQ
jgi:hypothetical protein